MRVVRVVRVGCACALPHDVTGWYARAALSTLFPLGDFRLRFSGDTNVGRKRNHNEDAFSLPHGELLAVVADGMGGHASGEVASRMAVDAVEEHFDATAEDDTLDWPFKLDRGAHASASRLATAIRLANVRIHEDARKNQQRAGMGTTLVAAYFVADTLLIGHVGDSRVYRVRPTGIEQLTEDHSMLNDYARAKGVRPSQLKNYPHKNVIVRALGMKESVQVDLLSERLRVGDCFLLCSDGLSGMITDEKMHAIVCGTPDLDRAVGWLIDAANEAGGVDNVTVVLVRVEAA